MTVTGSNLWPMAKFNPTLPKKSGVDGDQCDDFWTFFLTNCLTTVAQMDEDSLGYFENIDFQVESAVAIFYYSIWSHWWGRDQKSYLIGRDCRDGQHIVGWQRRVGWSYVRSAHCSSGKTFLTQSLLLKVNSKVYKTLIIAFKLGHNDWLYW